MTMKSFKFKMRICLQPNHLNKYRTIISVATFVCSYPLVFSGESADKSELINISVRDVPGFCHCINFLCRWKAARETAASASVQMIHSLAPVIQSVLQRRSAASGSSGTPVMSSDHLMKL